MNRDFNKLGYSPVKVEYVTQDDEVTVKSKRTRTLRPDVKALHTATKKIYLSENQSIYETNRAWEIWGEMNSLPRRIARFSKMQILFILIDNVWMSA